MSKQPSQHKNNAELTARQAAERLRLLYSWRESLAARRVPESRKASAVRRVDREIAAAQKQVRAEIERLGASLQHVFSADQQRPGNLVIEEKLRSLRHDIHQFNVLARAGTSADLGGMIELPLDHYPVELGLGRNSGGVHLGRDDFITLAVAAAIIIASCLGITWYHLWREDVTFTVDGPSRGQVTLHFRNDSSFTASFYGPWPESDAGLARHSYGIRYYCQLAGADAFQDCTNIREVWGYQGQVISPLKPIQVEPGVEVSVVLLLPALEKAYGDTIKAVRIECGNRRNRDDFQHTVDLPAP